MTNRPIQDGLSRRSYLRAAGSVATVGLAGCMSGTGGGGTGIDEIRVAYMPIYPDMQYFVMQEEGYFDELPVEVTSDQFPDGPSIVQASAKGDFDVMMFGVVPAMIIMDKGIPSKITAANIKNAMKILASDEFASMWEEYGKEAFARFEERTGRRFKFGTFPPGSVPDILLRFWIEKELGLDPATDVDIVGMAGASAVRQGLLAGKIDGTSIMEPVPTIIESKGAPYREIAWAGDFMPGQPAAVTLMHDRLRRENRDVAKAFVEQHIRATEFTNENPDTAAAHASKIIGSSLPVETARKAMQSKASQFISNPHEIESGAKIFSGYANRLDKIGQELTIEQMFDYGVYDEVAE